MLDCADMFALSGTLLLTLDTDFSVQVLTRYINISLVFSHVIKEPDEQ